jgi:hypothetical protein
MGGVIGRLFEFESGCGLGGEGFIGIETDARGVGVGFWFFGVVAVTGGRHGVVQEAGSGADRGVLQPVAQPAAAAAAVCDQRGDAA